jgi:transformation/transcription domain-associated protein
LNPEFLFPELSKQKKVFVSLMKALSIHLRPAPYPYGLLTLRLLGKLGGKNRRVLREPIDIADPNTFAENSIENISLEFAWSAKPTGEGEENSETESGFKIKLPIQRCLELLKRTSNVEIFDSEVISSGEISSSEEKEGELHGGNSKPQDVAALLSNDIGDVDLLGYCRNITRETTLSQVKAAIQVLRSALTKIINVPNGSLVNTDIEGKEVQKNTAVQIGSGTFDMQTIATGLSKYNSEFHTIAIGLMFGCSFAPIREEELSFVKGLMTSVYVIVASNQANIVRVDANGSSIHVSTGPSETNDDLKEFGEDGLGSLKPFGYFELNGPLKYTTDPLTVNKALAEFLTQPSPALIEVGLEILKHVLELPKLLKSTDSDENSSERLDRGSMIYFENLLSALSDRCIASDWSMRSGLYKGITMMVEVLGQSWAKRYEIEIMNVALFAVKSVPAEMSVAGIKSFEFLVQLCAYLYGKPGINQKSSVPFVVDMLSLLKTKDEKSLETLAVVSKPCDDVLQMLINELASTSHLVR